jgi:putative addiction module component (TIGR02574 family)
MRLNEIPEIDLLSIAEKILLVEDLWNSIASDESNVPVPQNHIKELDRGLKRYSSHRGDILSLEEPQGRIEKRKRCTSYASFQKWKMMLLPITHGTRKRSKDLAMNSCARYMLVPMRFYETH